MRQPVIQVQRGHHGERHGADGAGVGETGTVPVAGFTNSIRHQRLRIEPLPLVPRALMQGQLRHLRAGSRPMGGLAVKGRPQAATFPVLENMRTVVLAFHPEGMPNTLHAGVERGGAGAGFAQHHHDRPRLETEVGHMVIFHDPPRQGIGLAVFDESEYGVVGAHVSVLAGRQPVRRVQRSMVAMGLAVFPALNNHARQRPGLFGRDGAITQGVLFFHCIQLRHRQLCPPTWNSLTILLISSATELIPA